MRQGWLSQVVIGTWLNVAGIVLGSIIGLLMKRPLSLANQFFFKAALGAFTVFCGLRLTWLGLNGTFVHVAKQLLIVILALVLGKLAGHLLHLQKSSNRLGRFARNLIGAAGLDNPRRFNEGFNVCALLFCAAPLGMLGAVTDGLSGNFGPLAVKAVMDALAAMSFVCMFGPGVLLSAVPVLAFQGAISLLCSRILQPILAAHNLLDPVNATAGLLIFCVALIIFEIKKVEVADYLPSLIVAPLLTRWLL